MITVPTWAVVCVLITYVILLAAWALERFLRHDAERRWLRAIERHALERQPRKTKNLLAALRSGRA